MKYLKWLFGLIALIILFFVVTCLLGPKKMDFDNSIDIAASPSIVYQLVNNVKNWETWSDWSKSDSTIVINYPGKTEGLGASYNWKGDQSGAGSFEILETEKNKSIKTKLMFQDTDNFLTGDWIFTPGKAGTELSWKADFQEEIPFMYRGVLLLTGRKKKQNTQYKKSLQNLKAIAEARAKGVYNGYKIKNIQLEKAHFVTKRSVVDMKNIESFLIRNLPSLASKVGQSGAEEAGPPCSLFYNWDMVNERTDMAAAIPVKTETAIQGFRSVNLPESKAIQVDYYGPYEGTIDAHLAIDAYLKDKGLFYDYPVIEQKMTDISNESDESKWLTKVTYYLSGEE